MTTDKQILTINWKFSRGAALIVLGGILCCVLLPSYFTSNYILDTPVFILLQGAITLILSEFFYNGLPRSDRLKAIFSIFALTCIYGIIANLFNQGISVSESSAIVVDLITLSAINASAIFTMLSITKLNKKVVERKKEESGIDSGTESGVLERFALIMKPIYLSVFIFAAFVAGTKYQPDLFSDVNFAVTVPFFFYMQMLMTLVLTYFCFGGKQLKEKYRIYFTVLSLALFIGALANLDHSLIIPKVGHRVLVNSATFVLMNAGALLSVLSFHMWKDFVREVEAKQNRAEQTA